MNNVVIPSRNLVVVLRLAQSERILYPRLSPVFLPLGMGYDTSLSNHERRFLTPQSAMRIRAVDLTLTTSPVKGVEGRDRNSENCTLDTTRFPPEVFRHRAEPVGGLSAVRKRSPASQNQPVPGKCQGWQPIQRVKPQLQGFRPRFQLAPRFYRRISGHHDRMPCFRK